MIVASPHAEPAHPIASISARTHVALWAAAADAINAIKADALEEAAEALCQSECLRNHTDDHMGDIEAAADELRHMAAALRSTEKGNTDV